MTSWRATVVARGGPVELEVELGGGEAPLALVGPNGSGKTTLLRIFCGAHTPSRGEIEVNGAVLFSSERGIDQPPEGRRVGYVPQGYGLFPHLKVIDNVAFGLLAKRPRSSATSRRNAAQRMLVELGCSQIAQRLPRQLSGGEQQRVALARALVIDPAILLMDEPLAALDAGARRRVRSFLAERLRALGRPSIVVTHDVRDVVALAADICVLEKGRVVQRGTLSELQKAPANDFVEEFVGMDPATPPGNANGSDVAPPPTTP